MGVQKKILTRYFDGSSQKVAGGEAKTLKGGIGELALGKPGDIWSRAYGPLVYAKVVDKDIEYGTFVEGLGILVNPNDVANMANFSASTTLKAGQTGAFMVSGAAVVPCKAVEDIVAGMNARLVGGYEAGSDTAVCVIEVNGLKETDTGSGAQS